MDDQYQTRYTLLSRVKQGVGADEAWDEFVSIYYPFVLILLRGMKIRWENQEDIAQEVMIKIHSKINKFSGRSKFRTWLISVVRNTAYNHLGKLLRDKEREEKYATDPVVQEMDRSDFEQMYQQQWEIYICSLAFKNIKNKFTGKAIKVFEMTMDDQDIEKICRKLKLTKGSVYCLRTRVKNALTDEVTRLCRQMEL
jgi:RNA polymerase sigma-70 factor (ECF subfamily)